MGARSGRAAPALQSAVGRMSADPPGPGCLRVFGCYPFGGALPCTAGTLSRMDGRNLRKGDGIVNWGGLGGFGLGGRAGFFVLVVHPLFHPLPGLTHFLWSCPKKVSKEMRARDGERLLQFP